MQDGTLSLFIAVIAALAYAAFFPFSTHLKLTDRDLWEERDQARTRTRTYSTYLVILYVCIPAPPRRGVGCGVGVRRRHALPASLLRPQTQSAFAI